MIDENENKTTSDTGAGANDSTNQQGTDAPTNNETGAGESNDSESFDDDGSAATGEDDDA